MSYQVGVDLGATFSAAAVCRPGGAAAEVVPLADRMAFVPTVVFVNPDGSVVVGDEADRRALADPQRVVRQFTRRIGDGVPVLAGGVAMPAEVLAARFVTALLDSVADRMGGRPARVTITHPAGWGTHRVAALRDSLAAQGLFGARFLPSPVAAVLAHSTRERIEPGTAVAVYDLGGAGFEAAVVRRDSTDQFAILGQAEDLELGGLDFDEVVFSHVTTALGAAWEGLDPVDPAVRAAVAGLRRSCTAAKETLSADTEVLIPVVLPGIDTRIRLTRAELEDAIRPAIEETAEAVRRAIASAGVEPDAVLLVGGSARVPLVTQTVSERLGRPVTVAFDTKGIVAAGAALDARGPIAAPTRVVPAAPAPTPVDLPMIIPPPPVGPPRADDSGRWLGLPRIAVAAVAATVLAAGAAVGLTMLARHTAPVSSDADTGSVQRAEEPTTRDQPTGRGPAPVTPTTQQPRPRKPATTSAPPKTTSSAPTTSKPPTSSTTTTTTTTTSSPPSPSTRASAR